MLAKSMIHQSCGRYAVVLGSAALLAGFGCSSDNRSKSGSETTPPKAAAAAPAEPAPAPPDEAKPKPVADAPAPAPTGTVKAGNETKEYTIQVFAPDDVAAGAESALHVVIKPKGEWHFNLEFPTSVKVAGPASIKIAKPKQGLDDAVAKSEEDGATWAVKVTPAQAGEGELTCDVKFAVCTETTCDPKKETLALKLQAK